jgi:hypothetical protein
MHLEHQLSQWVTREEALGIGFNGFLRVVPLHLADPLRSFEALLAGFGRQTLTTDSA